MQTYDQLASFVAVYEQGSYIAAAKKLNKSRATVREQVLSYEDHLGYELFEIVARMAKPTLKAKGLYHRAKSIVRQNEELAHYSSYYFHSEKTEITLYHDSMVPLGMIAAVEAKFHEHFPFVKVHWLQRIYTDAVDCLQNQTAELAIYTSRTLSLPDNEIGYMSLGSMVASAYCGTDSPLVSQQPVCARDMTLHTQYVCDDAQINNTTQEVRAPRYQTVSNNELRCHLIANDGWGILPDHIAEPYVLQGRLVKLQTDIMYKSPLLTLSIYYHQGNRGSKIIQTLISGCTEYAKQNLY